MSEPQRALNRILVALDASSAGLETLEAAAELAALLRAELCGLFVEDVNLLKLAGLPFAQETSLGSPTPRPLSPESMERTLRAAADRVRQMLAELAGQAQIRWSFQVTRGHIVRLPLDVAETEDLLILGRRSLHTPPRRRGRHAGGQPVVLLYDGSTSADRLLATVLDITKDWRAELVILLSPDGCTAEELIPRVQRRLAGRSRTARIAPEPIRTLADLLAAVRSHHAGLLFLNRDVLWLDISVVETLIEEVGCPIGIVCAPP